MTLKDIKIVAYRSLPCEAQMFVINGVEGCKDDFGVNRDIGDPDEPYACDDNQFVRNEEVAPEVLTRYGITEDEYREIQDQLEGNFCVGSCGWCV
jgi:hypothetical protein